MGYRTVGAEHRHNAYEANRVNVAMLRPAEGYRAMKPSVHLINLRIASSPLLISLARLYSLTFCYPCHIIIP